MKKYYNNTWKDVVDMLGSNVSSGLSSEECHYRKEIYGSNKIKLPKKEISIKGMVLSIINLYFILILLLGFFLLYEGKYILALLAIINLFANSTLRILHIRKRQKQLAELQKINNITVRVIRNNKEIIIKAEELVLGDIVIFQKGSLISADLRIIEAKELRVKEENITGERFYKEKFENRIEGEISNIGELSNILFKGSLITEGTGIGIVIGVGKDTYFGQIFQLLLNTNITKHTLDNKIPKEMGKITIIATIFGILLFILFNNKDEAVTFLIYSLFTIAIIPYWLFILIYSKYINNKERKNNVEIINYSSLYDFDDINVLLIDKLQGITKKEGIIKEVYTDNKLFNIEDIKYDKNINFERIIDCGLLCNNGVYNVKEDIGKGDVNDIAYLSYAAKNKIFKSSLDVKYRRIFQIPMESEKRFKTTLNKSKKRYRANVRGALDSVLDRCTSIMIDGIEVDIEDKDIEKIKIMDYNLSLRGYITEGIAYRSFSYEPTVSENIESNLVFVGIVALENPLRENINENIQYLRERRITPLVFTEDNKIAAASLGKKIGIIQKENQVMSGVELEALSKEELMEQLKSVRIFSRVAPDMKNNIINILAKDKYNILTFGENLSDLPALGLCKIGVAKGKIPDIVKANCDIYIKENYLDNIVNIMSSFTGFREKFKAIFNLLLINILLEILLIALGVIFAKEIVNFIIPYIVLNFIIVGVGLFKFLNLQEEKINIKKFYKLSIIYNGIIGIVFILIELLS